MTIGVGFKCIDGIVIASDSQITVGDTHKYEECKIFEYRRDSWSAIFTYAGDPELMRIFDRNFIAVSSDPSNGSFLASCYGISQIVTLSLDVFVYRAEMPVNTGC